MEYVRPTLCNVQNVTAQLQETYPEITRGEVLRHLDYLVQKGWCEIVPLSAIHTPYRLTQKGIDQAEIWAQEGGAQ